MTPGELALSDLHHVLRGAVESCGLLLSAGEWVILKRLLALSGAPGRLWVRLAARKGELFRQDSLRYPDLPKIHQALVALQDMDLVHRSVPWGRRLTLLRNPELKALLRERGLPVGGRRQDLVERLEPTPGPDTVGCWRLSGRSLVQRLERIWFRSAWRDRKQLLLERIGQVRWVEHPLSKPLPAFPDRRRFLAFFELLSTTEDTESALLAVERSQPRPLAWRGLDPRPIRVRALREQLRELERAGDSLVAAQGYERLLRAGVRRPGPIALRLAQCLDAQARPADGSAVCARWRGQSGPDHALALERTGRRLARKAKSPWVPAIPLRAAPTRTLVMRQRTGAGTGRPRWGQDALLIEPAVAQLCGQRRVLHAENGLWTTLFGLLFFDLFWLPVPGMLPLPGMDGPLDLGRPEFVQQRRQAFERRLAELEKGQAQELLRLHYQAGLGRSVRGVHWELATLSQLQAVVQGAGLGLLPVMERLGREGWSAARGLPDLVILPGAPTPLPGALPRTLGPGLLLAEVKGPSDSLRDAQRVWHDLLLKAGLEVEIWKVSASKST